MINEAIIQYNIKHLCQAYRLKHHKDGIYKKLKDDTTRDKIIKSKLEENDCDYKEVCKFLNLLARNANESRDINIKKILVIK